jgi:hypothetical protein
VTTTGKTGPEAGATTTRSTTRRSTSLAPLGVVEIVTKRKRSARGDVVRVMTMSATTGTMSVLAVVGPLVTRRKRTNVPAVAGLVMTRTSPRSVRVAVAAVTTTRKRRRAAVGDAAVTTMTTSLVASVGR